MPERGNWQASNLCETSTATLIVDNLNEDLNFIITPTFAECSEEQQALKLHHWKDKNGKYLSYRGFSSQCNKSKRTSKGLKLELEPTIGNRDQEFLDMQYSNLKEFSLILMKGIKKFCHKTINETATDINSTEKRNKRKKKKQNMEKEEFQKIKKTISRNKEAIKLVLKQRKFT